MRKTTKKRGYTRVFLWILTVFALLSSQNLMAQKSVAAGAAHVNQFTPLTTDIYTQSSNLTVKSSQVFFSDQFSDKANAILMAIKPIRLIMAIFCLDLVG